MLPHFITFEPKTNKQNFLILKWVHCAVFQFSNVMAMFRCLAQGQKPKNPILRRHKREQSGSTMWDEADGWVTQGKFQGSWGKIQGYLSFDRWQRDLPSSLCFASITSLFATLLTDIVSCLASPTVTSLISALSTRIIVHNYMLICSNSPSYPFPPLLLTLSFLKTNDPLLWSWLLLLRSSLYQVSASGTISPEDVCCTAQFLH